MDIKGIFTKNYIIGIDIGSSFVKIAQLAFKDDRLNLIKTDLKEIHKAVGGAGETDEIVSALRYLLRGIDIKKSKIIVNINCPHTAIKKITAPYMPKTELMEGIKLEAKNYFPFTVDESLLDFQILGDIVEKGVRKYEVIVAVSPQKTIEKYLSLLGKAGIKPASLICTSYALQKISERSHSSAIGGEGGTRCFIDIGELYTELIIISASGGGKEPVLVFSRKIPIAGADFTKAMTGVLVSDRGKTELSLDEAEKIKCEVGIPADGESKIIGDKISTTQILSMLRSPLEQLVSEIERCFDYYREEAEGGKINSLVLFGGGASLMGIVNFLSGELGTEVKLGDPLEGFKIEPVEIRERAMISYRSELAIGAALTEGKGINLLPLEIREETKRVIKRGALTAIATAVIFISVLLYAGMKIQLGSFEKRVSAAEKELLSLQPQLRRAEACHMADMVLVNEPYWEDLFKELSNLMPDRIYLTSLNMRDNIITMKGITASADGEQLISDFILMLEKGIFNNVKLVKTTDLEGRPGNEFELKCWTD